VPSLPTTNLGPTIPKCFSSTQKTCLFCTETPQLLVANSTYCFLETEKLFLNKTWKKIRNLLKKKKKKMMRKKTALKANRKK